MAFDETQYTEDNCLPVGGAVPVHYPKPPCPECEECEEATTECDYIPQACIKIKNKKLFSCSVAVLPAGCSKTVKIYDTDMNELFVGTLAAANAYIQSTLEQGNYYAAEFITCEGGQTETPNLCFGVLQVDDQTKEVICGTCCQCPEISES